MKKKKMIANSLKFSDSTSKPSTVTRAGITAEIKMTRGKQLVEHSPFLLIPDPQNPRPGELIDDKWLRKYLKVGTKETLCCLNSDTEQFLIPDIKELEVDYSEEIEESYNFLKGLAYSIRKEGLIEPIEIFLADKANDPDYFTDQNVEFGYVVLEGHQRRLAGMMAEVPFVTCIEITDETMLAKLKVKHRKIRRQLSENNLRKGLSVSQNFQIVHQLLLSGEGGKISARELSSIIGLNEAIAGALKKISLKIDEFPPLFIEMIKNNLFTFKDLRKLASKSYSEIEEFIKLDPKTETINNQLKRKPRGRSGGAIKKSATFKINNKDESFALQKFLINRFPELKIEEKSEFSFKDLEEMLLKIKALAVDGCKV